MFCFFPIIISTKGEIFFLVLYAVSNTLYAEVEISQSFLLRKDSGRFYIGNVLSTKGEIFFLALYAVSNTLYAEVDISQSFLL